ncbi:MAG: membrane integrity-associated transporter subunit PqiC, partial [Rhodospirillales bacterium]|nr:membrane integrity-associated transporter subunit PqiC [Rhodospirillales bacterium]
MSARKNIKKPLWALMLIGGLALAACAQPEVPRDQFYRLVAAKPEQSAPNVFSGILQIDRFVADGLTAGRPIVFSISGRQHQLQEYHYHFWTQAPTIMLRDELVAYLRQAKVAPSVVTPDMRVAANYVISGKIRRLERVDGPPTRSVVELELAVRRIKGEKLLLLRTYRDEVQTADSTVSATVDALNASLNK